MYFHNTLTDTFLKILGRHEQNNELHSGQPQQKLRYESGDGKQADWLAQQHTKRLITSKSMYEGQGLKVLCVCFTGIYKKKMAEIE